MPKLSSSASKAIKAALEQIDDPEIQAGLQNAHILIEQALPELEVALSETIQGLDDASGVVDAGEDEEYAYQEPLENAKEALRRYEEGDYAK